MRKIFTLLLLVAGFAATAQQYNNEWINYSQTYYKIKVANEGLYRIPKSLLDANGLGNVPVESLELWRNGEKVPFYPSVSGGVLPSGGYLEFWGERNDGKPDKPLYRQPEYQHTTKYSLQTDTAIYFLSVNTNQSGFRYREITNNVAGNSLPVEQYFMDTAGYYFNSGWPNLGFASQVGVYVYSSSYDIGEVFGSGDIYPSGPRTASLTGLNVYAGGPASSIKFGASGNALNGRNIRVSVNGVVVKDTTMNYFNDLVSTAPVNNSDISSGTASVTFTNTSANGNDRMQVSFFEFTYPRNFDFNGLSNFKFELPARSAGYFLQISNFNAGSAQPVLYDMKNGERYVGDVAGGFIRFALPGAVTSRHLVLVNQEPGNVTTVTSMTTRTFTDYNKAAFQGDYVIISNPLLYTGSSGNNPVNDYKVYRESAAGGSHKVIIADINELTDQFAFGIKKHPLSIRNFIRYARVHFTTKLKFVFLIGRGMNYVDYQAADRRPATYPFADRLNLVPTFGYPGSDNLLSAEDLTIPVAATPIGRLSVVSGTEIEDYLEKIKEYDLAQKNAPNTIDGRAWMKNVVHVTGSSDPYLGVVLCNYMDIYRHIIKDTSFGANVTTFCKTSTNPTEIISADRLSQKFAEGISILTYFGHSSSTTLEFNIDNPQNYNNQGKYPIFLVNGCKAGDFFTYYPQRLTANETLSEKFTLAKQRGSIGFVASTHFGIVNYLNIYLTEFYSTITVKDYGLTLGETLRDAIQHMIQATGTYDFYSRLHAEQMTLHGDPALLINAQPRPDYALEDQSIKLTPTFISLAENNFNLKIKLVNLGKAYADSVRLEIKRQFPDGSTGILYNQKIPGIRYADSLELTVPIISNRDKGLHRIIATIDADNAVDEITETNNTITKEFYIIEEEARPVYPYNFAIINNASQKLYASTANALSALNTYVMEIDTTQQFNSSMKMSKTVTSVGGVLEFDPGISYQDSMVYYWRVAQIPKDNSPYHWNNASFRYVNAAVDGFGQSHFYQHLRSATEHISLTDSLKWAFGKTKHFAYLMNGVYPTTTDQGTAYGAVLDDTLTMGPGCAVNELIINVVDPVTFKPWVNQYVGSAGLYGSHTCGSNQTQRKYNFMFYHYNAATRKQAMDFLDLIPNGHYVMIRNNASPERPGSGDPANVYVDAWKADSLLYGPGKSLYHQLFYAGFYELDSFYVPRSFNFIYKKGDTTFPTRYINSKGPNDHITLLSECFTPDTVGIITSPKFGPARKWFEVKWSGASVESPSNDDPVVDVVGVDKNKQETILYQLNKSTPVQDVSTVDPVQYPYMFLRMRNIDSVTLTPYQLKDWRIHYEPQPEGAIAPNMYLVMRDTFDLGDTVRFGVAFKNISKQSFDSIAVRATVLGQNNVTHVVYLGKQKPIITGDTVTVNFKMGTVDYSGSNMLFVDFNYDNHQPEYEHFNNFLYHPFYVRPDRVRPLLDVTFDGVHILNKDIVSAKPHIQIKLKDESKFMLLTDTTLGSVQIRYPDNTLRTYHYDSDTLRFTPATSGSDNTATIDFTPQFTSQINPEGDDYELIVRGKDKSGNKAGDIEYRVAFKVIAKPMISNMLNYPNPFSTSTAFVFTITGSELPQNIRIQILTVTGKIVREITMNELGPLHIGRNITEFKWDGTDQYGQKLGNGVYLYRVITSMDGKSMDKYKAAGDNTDKFFNNGYGKMYLMR
ncbi:C25 family cysteine peptidase [Longitalea luteola]|uniref:putative type IX secretion system sortase PorU2 n=1 Tax=Longitalea luteola TaxID=2812563 RepID=UPI001A95B260|nr:C25 family cysteine peptidase [Longitalea luteola]